ncbi:MAG: hypothetical protein R6V55_16940, partial [Desulfovermiculus sp.]
MSTLDQSGNFPIFCPLGGKKYFRSAEGKAEPSTASQKYCLNFWQSVLFIYKFTKFEYRNPKFETIGTNDLKNEIQNKEK